MRLFFVSLVMSLVLTIAPAMAGSSYMMYWMSYSPWSKTIAAGPFPTLSECLSAVSQAGYHAGGQYECDPL